jgi:hypothetical protein
MLGRPYWYLVPWAEDLQEVLDTLRAREFQAGRYYPAVPSVDFVEPAFSRQRRGARHDSIEDAIMDAGEEGTRSILDIHTVSSRPGFGTASPFPRAAYMELYGTEHPSQYEVRANKEFLRWASPAQCVYILIYDKGDEPAEVLFAGRSFG